MLVVRLVSRGAPLEKDFRIVGILRAIVRVIVVDLVIGPRNDPRKRGMRGLEIGVPLVQPVAVAIFLERPGSSATWSRLRLRPRPS